MLETFVLLFCAGTFLFAAMAAAVAREPKIAIFFFGLTMFLLTGSLLF
jgi:hypothetical protein